MITGFYRYKQVLILIVYQLFEFIVIYKLFREIRKIVYP